MDHEKFKYHEMKKARNDKRNDLDIIYAFVTLKSMDDIRLLKNAYHYSRWERFTACFNSEKQKHINQVKF